MDFGQFFVPNAQAPKLVQPGDRPFADPTQLAHAGPMRKTPPRDADLRAEPIEKSDHIFLLYWSLERAPYQGLVLIKRAEHIDALSMRLWRNRMRLSAR